MKRFITKSIFSIVMLFLLLSTFKVVSYAATNGITISGNVDYSAVYNYDYYIAHNPDVQRAYNGDDVKTLNHFIEYGMAEGRQGNNLFDVNSYRLANPDVRHAYGSDLRLYYLHYINYGQKEGRVTSGITQMVGAVTKSGGIDYSAVYNYDYYVAHNPDAKNAFGGDDIATLNQFIKYGMAEGRQGNDSFDVNSYRLANPDVRHAYGRDLKLYYLHYINYGKKEGRVTSGVTQMVGAVTKSGGIDYSAVYNYDYYVAHNPDVKQTFGGDDIATLNQFIKYGMAEGRQGNDSFDVNSYRLANPDVRHAYGSDLKLYYLHYINYGKKEGRVTSGVTQIVGAVTKAEGIDYSAVYNYDYYIAHNSDVKNAFGGDDIATLNQFIKYGMAEGRQGNDDFNVYYYKANYPDLQMTYENNLKSYYLHYINYGKSEGRNAKELAHDYTGWWNNDGNTYYYENGSFCTGWKTISGKKYFFSDMGALKSSLGIDVSSHQGTIDWQAVKNGGIKFAMIRVGYGDDLINQDDSTALYNMKECERLGIPYGVYLYSYALTNSQANSEASHLLRMIEGRKPSLGLCLDVEDDPNSSIKLSSLTKQQLTNNIVTFCEIVKNKGYSPMVYASASWINNKIEYSSISRYGIWVANYGVNKPSIFVPYAMWQYTEDGSVSGVSGRVDMDIMIN